MILKSVLLSGSVLALATAGAATLPSVPMQGGMVMPMIGYHADHGHLHVMVDPTVPQLTPLLVSHPGDGFEAADPWFDALDPSRQGLAFSLRYGFVMDSMTEPLPEGTAIWIRKLSGSPGLAVYRYRDTAPKVWEPIFGTDGSPAAMAWNGMMFHPAFTAPAGTNSFTATFEAYLVDVGTGEEMPGTGTGPFVFNWTTVPDGRPEVSIAPVMVIAWPAATTGYVLESAETPSAGEWQPVTNAPVTLNGQSAVLLDQAAAKKFFRLRRE